MPNLEILKCLSISTANVEESTMNMLCSDTYPKSDGIIAYSKGEDGSIVSIDTDFIQAVHFGYIPNEAWKLPEDLKTVIKFACEHGCSMLNIDRDANECEGLPVYDWS